MIVRPDPADEYDFYPCLVDGAPASIYVNLRFDRDGPATGADTRYWIAIQILDPGPYGIGTLEEAELLNAFEEGVIERAQPHGLIYVGRLRSAASWEVTFYGPPGRLDILQDAADHAPAGRHAEAHSARDPTWRCYRELFLPDTERRRWMDDRRLVQILQEQGDGLTRPRRIDHHTSFATAEARDAFVAAAVRSGFTLERAERHDDRERPFAAQLSRLDRIELGHIHEVVMILADAAAAHGGQYDRWVSSIERG